MTDFKKTNGLLYIIDPDYNLVFTNDEIKEFVGKEILQGKCYKEIKGRESPCSNCVLNNTASSFIMYSPIFKTYFNASIADVNFNNLDCKLVVLNEFDGTSKNNILNMTDLPSYDILFECNLKTNMIRYLLADPQKFDIPLVACTLSDYIKYNIYDFVHPDDTKKVVNFWYQFLEGNANVFDRTAHEINYRRKKKDDTYTSVHLTVTKSKNLDSSVLFAFVREIDRYEYQEDTDLNYPFLADKRVLISNINNVLSSNEVADEYALIVIDIEHFHIYAEWYGLDAATTYLDIVAKTVSDLAKKYDGLGAYLGADDFGIFLKNKPNLLENMEADVLAATKKYSISAGFLPALGMAVAKKNDINTNADSLYDRAIFALSTAKDSFSKRSAVYKTAIAEEIITEHSIISQVQNSIDNHDFVFYLQPQCDINSGKVVGAEALIRWHHPTNGMISPGLFVPILEKRGFITSVDCYIWERVIMWMDDWRKRGNPLFTISINVSRIDFISIDVAAYLLGLLNKYNIEPKYLDIEVTESAYTENNEKILGAITDLKNAGFSISMDDFGSGYSALYMLKDLNIDVLKIDMKFLAVDNNAKVAGIYESIRYISQVLGLRVIVEGVENQTQIDMLKNINFQYVQGYYFYRPMPIEDFEKMIFEKDNLDTRGFVAKVNLDYTVKDLLANEFISDSTFNNMLGPTAFFEVCEDNISVINANERFLDLLGIESLETSDFKYKVLNYIYLPDHEKFLAAFETAYNSGTKESLEYIHGIKADQSITLLKNRIFFLSQTGDKKTFIVFISPANVDDIKREYTSFNSNFNVQDFDITNGKLTEEEKREAKRLMAQISSDQVGCVKFDLSNNGEIEFLSSSLLAILGYNNLDDFKNINTTFNITELYPTSNRHFVRSYINSKHEVGDIQENVAELLLKDKPNTVVCHLIYKVISNKYGMVLIRNITNTVHLQEVFLSQFENLVNNIRELKLDLENLPYPYRRIYTGGDLQLYTLSDSFLRMTGYSKTELEQLFYYNYLAMVHPSDRNTLLSAINQTTRTKEFYSVIYRIKHKDKGYITVNDTSNYVDYHGATYVQGFVRDITEDHNQNLKISAIKATTKETIFFLSINKKTNEVILDAFIDTLKIRRNFGKKIEKIEPNRYRFKQSIDKFKDDPATSFIDESKIISKEDYYFNYNKKSDDNQNINVYVQARFVGESNEDIVYLYIFSDVTNSQKTIDSNKMDNDKFDLALKASGLSAFTWDVKEDTFVIENPLKFAELNVSELIDKATNTIENFPSSVQSHRYIAKGHLAATVNYLNSMMNNFHSVPQSFELPLIKRNGETLYINFDIKCFSEDNVHPTKVIGVFKDVSKIKKLEFDNSLNQQMINHFMENAIFAIQVNIDLNVSSVIKNYQLWKKEYGELPSSYKDINQLIAEKVIASEFRSEYLRNMSQRKILTAFNEHNQIDSFNCLIKTKKRELWVKFEVIIVKSSVDNTTQVNIFMMDIDKDMREELRLEQLAYSDALTGVMNRSTALPMMENNIDNLKKNEAALILLDIDNFKAVNDVFGHIYGDNVLKEITAKMRKVFNKKDIICRYGGDEFLVYCQGNKKHVKNLINKFICSVYKIVKATGQDVVISMSAGFAMYPSQGKKFKELLNLADIAVFAAKNSGKNVIVQYSEQLKDIEAISNIINYSDKNGK